VQLGPAERRGDVDRGVLPDGPASAGQPANEETVELDLLTGQAGVDVALGRRRVGTALVGIAVARDQRQALAAGVQADADKDAPDTVL
jgi:hypothetical protein